MDATTTDAGEVLSGHVKIFQAEASVAGRLHAAARRELGFHFGRKRPRAMVERLKREADELGIAHETWKARLACVKTGRLLHSRSETSDGPYLGRFRAVVECCQRAGLLVTFRPLDG